MSWTRITEKTEYNSVGECWMRDHVPKAKECSHCTSGVNAGELVRICFMGNLNLF